MKTVTTSITPTLLASSIAFGLGTSSVFAADFRSTYTFPSVATPAVDTVIVNFSTIETSGIIDASHLTDLSIELLEGTTSVYLDEVIIGGVVQDIGGVPRTIPTDISFDFDLDILEYVSGFNNDILLVQSGVSGASGVTYNISGDENQVNITRYIDGEIDLFGSASIIDFNLNTAEVTAPPIIPEPSTVLGLLAVSSIGVLTRKRK